MKRAAVYALSELAKELIPEDIQHLFARVYPDDSVRGLFSSPKPFSPKYIIPRLFDPRVVPRVARAVASAVRS